MALEQFELEFTKDGSVFDETAVTKLLNGLAGKSDLIVLAHGWNNNLDEAKKLYDDFVTSMNSLLAGVPSLAGRQLALLRVFWPSKKFTDSDLIPGGGAASATGENDAALLKALEELKNDPERLGEDKKDPARVATVDRAIALVGQLEASEEARHQFVLLMRALLNPDEAMPTMLLASSLSSTRKRCLKSLARQSRSNYNKGRVALRTLMPAVRHF